MNRSISADLIKTLSIFGVVFIHGFYLFRVNAAFQEYFKYIFRFCVPCFIIIWAFFNEKSYLKKDANKVKPFVINRLKHLFIVYLVWSLFYFLIFVNWDTINIRNMFTNHFIGYGWSGQYFFIILFQLIIIFPILRALNKTKFLFKIIITILIILYIYLTFFYDYTPQLLKKLGNIPFVYWIPHTLFGIYMANAKPINISPFFSFVIFLIPLEHLLLNYYGCNYSGYLTLGVLISSILFCRILLSNNIEIKSKKITNLISFIGKNTMTIFVTNPIIILLFEFIIPPKLFPDSLLWKIFTPFISTILVFSVCLIITKLINQTKLKGIIN